MLHTIIKTTKGIITICFYGINTICCCLPLFIVALFKLIIPLSPWRRLCSSIILWLAELWVKINSINLQLLNNTTVHVTGDSNLNPDDWYLVIANHQSWADIVLMQHVLRGKVPFLKFFLKQELIYVPLLGLAWWALDFPFMNRFSKAQIRNNPHFKGKDIEATRKACEKFKTQPISIVNYVEGTRFTKEKNIKQGRPYKHLLKPKAGGVGYVMTLLGEQIHYILNLTINYPDQQGHYWKFLTGELKHIHVHIEVIPVSEIHRGNYIDDTKFRINFQSWLTSLWQEKDQYIELQQQQQSQKNNL